MFRKKLRLLHQITNLILTLTPGVGGNLIRKESTGNKRVKNKQFKWKIIK